MNVVMMTGEVVSAPNAKAASDGTPKTSFGIEVDGGRLPLRFSVLCFGGAANIAARLVEGDYVALSGRLSAHAVSRTITLIANNIEKLTEENQNEDSNQTSS